MYENATLFLQHGLIYKRFFDAIITGDPGWVQHCVKVFSIWLQGDNAMHNYRKESIHLIACFTHIWSREFRNHWMENCLYNMKGSRKSFMPSDLINEYEVREVQEWLKAQHNPANAEYLRFIIALQLLVFKEVRGNFADQVGATEHYSHSSVPSAAFDVRAIATFLMEKHVFMHTPGRKTTSDGDPTVIIPSMDLFTSGMKRITSGHAIRDYQKHLKSRMADPRDEQLIVSDEVGFEDEEGLEDELVVEAEADLEDEEDNMSENELESGSECESEGAADLN